MNGDSDKITEYLYKDDSTTIDHIEAYSDLQIIYDDMVFINGKVSDVDGDFYFRRLMMIKAIQAFVLPGIIIPKLAVTLHQMWTLTMAAFGRWLTV